MDSRALSPGDGWQLWAAEWHTARGGLDPAAQVEECRQAFLGGYRLAESQSTQGSGEWHPFWIEPPPGNMPADIPAGATPDDLCSERCVCSCHAATVVDRNEG